MSGLHLKDVGQESTSQGCGRGRKRERGRMPGPRPEGRASGPRLWPEACLRHQRRRKGSCNSRGGVRAGSRRKGGAGPAAGGKGSPITLRGRRLEVKAARSAGVHGANVRLSLRIAPFGERVRRRLRDVRGRDPGRSDKTGSAWLGAKAALSDERTAWRCRSEQGEATGGSRV